MAKIALTDVSVRALRPPEKGQKTYWDSSLSGFGIRVSQGGAKTWIVLDPRSKIRTQETVGRYPLISLKMAREEVRNRLADATLHTTVKSRVKATEAVSGYLAEIERKRRTRTHADYKRLLGKFVFPTRLADCSQGEIAKQLARLKNTPAEHTHAFVVLRAFFNWAYQQGYIETSPLARMKAEPYRKRERVLTDDELKRVWQAATGTYGRIIKLLIMTGCRPCEIRAMQPDWVKGYTLTIPSAVAKNGKEHQIPVGDLTLSLIGPTAFQGMSKAKARLDTASNVSGWTVYDLRRTFRTKWAELGISIEIAERYINHVSGVHSGVQAIYNRYKYLPEMQAAVATWERYLANLTRPVRLVAA